MTNSDSSELGGSRSSGSADGPDPAVLAPNLRANLRPNGEKLLRAAIEVIDEGGVEALRVEHLVRKVGLTIPEVYRQFGSRQELVNAVQAERYVRSLVESRDHVDQVFERAGDAEEFFILLNRVMWEALRPERLDNLWRRINVLGSAYANPEMLETVSEITRTQNRAIIELLQKARQLGWIRAEADVAGAYSWFVSVSLGRVSAKLELRSPLHSERWTLAILDVVNQELFGRDSPSWAEISVPLSGTETNSVPLSGTETNSES
jgi:AcrR family transcriptional regulator